MGGEYLYHKTAVARASVEITDATCSINNGFHVAAIAVGIGENSGFYIRSLVCQIRISYMDYHA